MQAPLPEYRAWKQNLLDQTFQTTGLMKYLSEIPPLLEGHGRGRRRVTFHVRRPMNGKLVAGFMARKSHQLVPVPICPILVPELQHASSLAQKIAQSLYAKRQRAKTFSLDILCTATCTGLDIDLRGAGRLEETERQALCTLAEEEDLARLTHHGERLLERRQPQIQMGNLYVTLPPGAFLQATEKGEERLAEAVLQQAYCPDKRKKEPKEGGFAKGLKILDLFCGFGPFALRLARHHCVHAIDCDLPALQALQTAHRLFPTFKPLTIEKRDLFRSPLSEQELRKFDLILFNPPRAGALQQMPALARSNVPKILAISCNPTTFSRDAQILCREGYKIESMKIVDQFLYSPHVEIFAAFGK